MYLTVVAFYDIHGKDGKEYLILISTPHDIKDTKVVNDAVVHNKIGLGLA